MSTLVICSSPLTLLMESMKLKAVEASSSRFGYIFVALDLKYQMNIKIAYINIIMRQ